MTSEINIPSLNQKFDLRSYQVFFDINDGLWAEELLDSLDRATKTIKRVFNLQDEPAGSFYLVPDETIFEKVLGSPLKMGEKFKIVYDQGAILFAIPRISSKLGELAVTEFGHLIFNAKVGEKEVKLRQWRTPSWLREGFALQAALPLNKDGEKALKDGWVSLQTAQAANQLIIPELMLKDITLIPNPKRRELAKYQAFYMVKFVLSMYCDSFFGKYSTLMNALDDMEAENCFRQITSFDFDKFFKLFTDWVSKTNAWTAME